MREGARDAGVVADCAIGQEMEELDPVELVSACLQGAEQDAGVAHAEPTKTRAPGRMAATASLADTRRSRHASLGFTPRMVRRRRHRGNDGGA